MNLFRISFKNPKISILPKFALKATRKKKFENITNERTYQILKEFQFQLRIFSLSWSFFLNFTCIGDRWALPHIVQNIFLPLAGSCRTSQRQHGSFPSSTSQPAQFFSSLSLWCFMVTWASAQMESKIGTRSCQVCHSIRIRPTFSVSF